MQDPRDLMAQAKQIVQDPKFAEVMQWSVENAPSFADGIANSLLPIVLGFQQKNQVDDDTMLGPILIVMITAALEVGDAAGDKNATPEQIEPIRAKIIDHMGRVDAESAQHEGMPEEQEPGNEMEPGHEQTEPPADMQVEGEAPRNRISAMLGAR